MERKIYKNVKLGKNVRIYPPVVIGFPPQDKKERNSSLTIGNNSVIRPFTVIYRGVVIGNNFRSGHSVLIREDNIIGDRVSVGTNTTLEPGNRIGNNVRIHSGCFLEYVIVEDDVFIGPGVIFTDDPHPPCPRFKECILGARVGRGVKIGANSTVLPGVVIGENSLIGAGSVVTQNIPENSVVCGNPAKVIKKIKDLRCFKRFFKKPYDWERKT